MKKVAIFVSVSVRLFKSIQVEVEDDMSLDSDLIHSEFVIEQLEAEMPKIGLGWDDYEVDDENYEFIDDSCPTT